MKNLDLKEMGVQEMDAVEVKGTDGGFTLRLIIGRVEGVLDGVRGNAEWKWFWQ